MSSREHAKALTSTAQVSLLRRGWDHLPRTLRQPIIWLMRSERVRLTLLDKLGIRRRSGFITLSHAGLGAISSAMARLAAEGPAGDYYGFGLYRGYTFWHAQGAADGAGIEGMRFFGFDSFAGLPDVKGEDRRAGIFIPGDYACTREAVERELAVRGFDWSRGVLIEGYFDASLTESIKGDHRMGPAALVMIDCDLYQSTVPVLAFLADALQDGTIMLFDDWYCFGEAKDQGEPRAFNEFLTAHQEWRADDLMDFGIYGKAFVMHPSGGGLTGL